MSEQRLAAEVKFNLSKENIFVSVRLIYTLRLAENEENFGWIFWNLQSWKRKKSVRVESEKFF